MERKRDWRELCGAVTQEHDSNKLIALLQELTEALDRKCPDLARPTRGHSNSDIYIYTPRNQRSHCHLPS
jgi:hypothetical protein